MSANSENNLMEFLDHFHKASQNAHSENDTVDEAVIPVSEDKPLEFYTKAPAAVAPVAAAPVNIPVQPVAEEKQQFSFCSGSGDPPSGYRVSESCANCEYFCGASGGGHCYKYDFPCASNYLCDTYERCEPMQYFSHTENVYKFPYDVTQADAHVLTDYAQDLQNGLRHKLQDKGVKLSTLSSYLYLYDQESAASAAKLSKTITDGKAYKAFVRLFSQYYPHEARQMLSAMPTVESESDKVPSYLPLFRLAQSMGVTSEEVYSQYEQLYAQQFGDASNCYLMSEESDMSGVITAPVYAGETLDTENSLEARLLKAAENRVKALAAKNNREYTDEEVQAELNRLQQARPKLNASL